MTGCFRGMAPAKSTERHFVGPAQIKAVAVEVFARAIQRAKLAIGQRHFRHFI